MGVCDVCQGGRHLTAGGLAGQRRSQYVGVWQGKQSDEPAFYILFESNQARNRARRYFGPRCLSCRVESSFHSARGCEDKCVKCLAHVHFSLASCDPDAAQ